MSAKDYQVGGDHYKKQAIQPIDYIMANQLDFCEGNIVKYITRWKEKGGIEDLEKVRHYVQFLIDEQKQKEIRKSISSGRYGSPSSEFKDFMTTIEAFENSDKEPLTNTEVLNETNTETDPCYHCSTLGHHIYHNTGDCKRRATNRN